MLAKGRFGLADAVETAHGQMLKSQSGLYVLLTQEESYMSRMSCLSAVGGLYSVREAKSALSQHSATNRCKCTSWMTLLLRDVDLGQIDHMAAKPTHGPHHSCSSSSWLGASDRFLAIANLFPYGGSN